MGGGTFVGAEPALALTIGASIRQDRTFFRARGLLIEEVFEDSFLEISALVGRAYLSNTARSSGYLGALSIGVGYVRVGRSGGLFSEAEDTSVGTVGAAIGAQLYRQPVRFGGLGLDGFANVNPEASAAGIALSLQLGVVR